VNADIYVCAYTSAEFFSLGNSKRLTRKRRKIFGVGDTFLPHRVQFLLPVHRPGAGAVALRVGIGDAASGKYVPF